MEIEGTQFLTTYTQELFEHENIVLNEDEWSTVEIEFKDILYNKLYDRLDICNGSGNISWMKVRNIYFEPRYKFASSSKEAQYCCSFNQCICTIQHKKVYVRRKSIPDSHLNGTDNNPQDLSERGWLRSECISELFQKNSTLTPKKIYAQSAANHKKDDENLPDSRRHIQTVAPLARALNLVVDNTFLASEVKELAKNISELPTDIDPVLISWNHEDMRKFLINFGMSYRIAPKYPKNRYDLVWIIDNSTQFYSFSQNCSGLGDYRFNIYKDNL
ncbi:hypothetical protein PIROE2DRAFT_68882 [Piromyces sp. E2]|nr:hypothetical protein PIROE2DRAFT_68882 [Piromyces sp. E2]|eukprot:OUM67009.1 hypothetical protein PIROE2DRAFT_68882 [Piromyces sp. E2]